MGLVVSVVFVQRTPWGGPGGVEKRGGWKTSRMTPLPKRGLGPPSYSTFSTPRRRQCSVFPVQKSTTEQTRSSFGESAFSGTFSSPHTFCTPPYHGPIRGCQCEILELLGLKRGLFFKISSCGCCGSRGFQCANEPCPS